MAEYHFEGNLDRDKDGRELIECSTLSNIDPGNYTNQSSSTEEGDLDEQNYSELERRRDMPDFSSVSVFDRNNHDFSLSRDINLTNLPKWCKLEVSFKEDGIAAAIDEGRQTSLRYAKSENNPHTMYYEIAEGASNIGNTDRIPSMYSTIFQENSEQVQSQVTKWRDDEERTLLHHTARLGRLEKTRSLVVAGAEIDAVDKDGQTPLHYASSDNNLAFASYLVDNGACVNVKDADELTPLHFAILYGNVEIAELLVNRGALDEIENMYTLLDYVGNCSIEVLPRLLKQFPDVNAHQDDGSTLLHHAAANGNTGAVQHLFNHGAEMDARDLEGLTPLHRAAKFGHLDIINFLWSEGADVNEQCQGDRGMTPLLYTVMSGYHDNVRRLFGEIVNTNVNWEGEQLLSLTPCVQNLVSRPSGADVNIANTVGETPLHWAAKCGYVEIVRQLHASGADLTNPDIYGYTPLHYASDSGFLRVVTFLIENGADRETVGIMNGWTPLHVASAGGHINIVRYLCDIGCDINQTDNDGRTPLHQASSVVTHDEDSPGNSNLNATSQIGLLEVVQHLVNNGAEITARDSHSKSSVQYASQNKHRIIAEYLLTKEVGDVNETNIKLSALHRASILGYLDVVECLLESREFDLNECDDAGWTPLHYAAHMGHLDVIVYFLEGSADWTKVDGDSRTPLYHALLMGHLDVAKRIAKKTGGKLYNKDIEGLAPIHHASNKGHKHIVEYIHSRGANVNDEAATGLKPLHYAAKSGHKDIAEYLTKKGADLTATDRRGWTPLHYASSYGDKSVVEYLTDKMLNEGCCIDTIDDEGMTILHLAAHGGHLDVIMYLLSLKCEIKKKGDAGKAYNAIKGINVNMKNKHKQTPLHCASHCGHVEVVKYLVDEGADISQIDKYHKTPLNHAAEGGHLNVVQYLSNQQVEFYGRIHLGPKRVNKRLYGNKSSNERYEQEERVDAEFWTPEEIERRILPPGARFSDYPKGCTLVHIATDRGCLEELQCLINQGVGLENAVDGNDDTPLHWAAYKGRDEIVQYLIQCGALVNAINKKGESPLHQAACCGWVYIARLLLVSGGKIDSKNAVGRTPLHCASHMGQKRMVECLVNEGAKLNERDNDRWTPLLCASLKGHTDLVNIFVKKGCTIDDKNNKGETALHIASRSGQQPILQFLMEMGANIKEKDNNGNIPLHFAAMEGRLDILKHLLGKNVIKNEYASPNRLAERVKFLFGKGSKPRVNAKNNDGQTALHFASYRGHPQIVEYLLLEVQANAREKDNRGWTPLHYAANSGHLHAVKLLHIHGANPSDKDKQQKTALQIALQQNQIHVARYLKHFC